MKLNLKRDEELKLKSEYDALNNKISSEINEFIKVNQNTIINNKNLKPEMDKYKNNLSELIKRIKTKDEEEEKLKNIVRILFLITIFRKKN